jgi:hypothetical protein
MWAISAPFRGFKMFNDTVNVKGELSIVLTGPDGQVKDTRTVKNLIVNTGLAFIASRMVGTSPAVMSHMAVGSGTTAAAGGNTALETELGRAVLTGGTATANAVEYTATFAAGVGTGAVTEAGILNNTTGGTLLCRTVFAVVNKAAADTLAVTWTITHSAA